jgi:hypothetical protein
MADPEKLAELMLTATLSHYYSHFERRVEAAVDPGDEVVRREIAAAALDHVIGRCDPALGDELDRRRPELVARMVAERWASDRALFDMTRRLARPPFAGPINAVFNPLRRINLIIAAAAETPVGRYAQVAKQQFFGEALFADSAGLRWADLAGRNAIVYGAPDAPLIGELLAGAGWRVTETHVALGDRVFEGEHLALIACRARPDDPTLGDVIYTSADDRVLLGVNQLHHGPSDFVIGRLTRTGRYQIVTRADFARGPAGELLTTLPAATPAPAPAAISPASSA